MVNCFSKFFLGSCFLITASLSPAIAQTINEDYFGEAPLVSVENTLRIESNASIKTPFLRLGAKWRRGAILGEDLEFKRQGEWKTMPEGTELFAITFRDGFEDVWKKRIAKGELVPNVAWCAPHYEVKKDVSYCFYGSQNGVIMVGAGSYGSHYFPEYMATSFKFFGLKQVPKIEEHSRAFDKDFIVETEIRKISKKVIKYRVYLNDGESRSVIRKGELNRENDGSAILDAFGGSLRIMPDGKNSFTVEQIKTIIDDGSDLQGEFNYPYSIYQ